MSWVTDNWIPLTIVGGLVGVSWYAGKHFDESESYNASTKKTKPRKTHRIKTMIEQQPDMRITSSFHPDNPMVGHIEQKCSSSVCDEMVFTHDRMIGKRCLKCYYQNWEDLYDMGATDTPPPVDMSIPYDVRYKRNTPAEIAEREQRSIALMENVQKSIAEKTRKGYEKLHEKNRIERQKRQEKWANYENDREWDKQYAQIMKDKNKMSDKGWRKKYGLKSESYNADPSWNELMAMLKQQEQYEQHKKEQQKRMRNQRAKERRELKKHLKSQGLTEEEIKDYMKQLAIERRYKVAETFNADEGLWNDASKEQRLKWLKDAIPSIGDKYADYTWRELTPRLQEEMADESYDAETFAAYVNKADTQRVRQLLKQEFPNLKFSVVKDGGRMSVSIMAGDIDFSDINDDVPSTKRHWERWGNPKPVFDGRLDINQYHLDGYNPKYTPLFEKIVSIMKGEDWFDHSDSQTDYFHTAYYIDLNIGKWNKPYEYKPNLKRGTRPTLESLVYKQGYGDDALTGLKGAYDEETFEAPLARGRGRVGYQYEFCLNKDHSKAVRQALKKEHPQLKIRVKIDGCKTMLAWLISGNQDLNDENFDSLKAAIEQTMMDALENMDDADGENINVWCYLGDWTKNQDYTQNAETFEAKGYEPNKPFYATMHTERPTTVMHPIKCGHYKMVMGGTGVWDYPTFYDTIEEMVEGELFDLADVILADTEDKELIEQYKNLKTVGEARKWLSKTTGSKLNFAPCFKKEYDYDSKALNALPITPIPFDWFDAETFEASAVARKKAKTPVEKVLLHEELMNQAARNEMITKLTYDLAMRRGVHRQPMRTLKEAEYDSKLKKEFGDD